MKNNKSNRRRRGRSSGKGRGHGRRGGHEVAAHERSGLGQMDNVEDPATFWARSNARLGMEEKDDQGGGKRARGPIEFPCAVCGIFVSEDRWPKERHDVRCDGCRSAMSTILSDEDRDISDELRRTRVAEAKGKYDGLPELTEEDLAAVAEMKALAERRGNGQRGNNSRRGGGGRKRRSSNNNRNKSRSGGSGRRRRRSGGRGGAGRQDNAAKSSDD